VPESNTTTTTAPPNRAERRHPNTLPADVETLPWAAEQLGKSSEVVRETQAVYNAPDRMEYARIQYAYTTAIASIAQHQGNKEASFIRKFRELIAERQDAEEYDDEPEVRSIEARLNRLTAPVTFPVIPAAAYEAAALLPAAERAEESARLDAKYAAPTTASTNGTANRTLRKTRPLTAVR
jgi:hypothetical protein